MVLVVYLKKSVGGKVVRFRSDSVEVVNHLGSSGGTEPVNWQSYVVNASQSGAAILFGDAGESVSITDVGWIGGREKNISFTQKANEVRRVSVCDFSGLVIAVVVVVNR